MPRQLLPIVLTRVKEPFPLSELLLFLLLFSYASTVAAQSPGTFTPTGSMTTPRFLHTSTLLADGRVLIAGGERIEAGSFPTFFKVLNSAELYDPSTGTFTATGQMANPRTAYMSTFTLLPDGKVLATGGVANDGHALASAELYDPDTGTFLATGNMTTPRSGHTATLLNNGKVLIAGGWDGGTLSSAELYDPSTGSFTATGSMSRPWADTATLLPNGKVLITRGNPEGPPPYLSSAELYDLATGTFAFVGYLSTNHTGPTAVLLRDGKVLIAGGDVGDGDGSSNIAELFDPATGTFAATGKMIQGREQNTATLLPDGTVLFTGSHDGVRVSPSGFDHLATAELYDPVTGTFRTTSSMATGRELHTATLLNNGTVLITGGDQYWPTALGGAGGRDPAGAILASAEIYTPAVLVRPSIVTDLRFDRTSVDVGSSFSANFSGSNLTSQTFFDVRFTGPGSNNSDVVLNWQRGLTLSHDVSAGTVAGSYTIIGVRAHEVESDHTGNFVSVSATLTVSGPSNTTTNAPPDHMAPGDFLLPGQFRQSADGRFQLIYQRDGNLVLYRGWSAPLWWTSTNSPNPGFAVMQGDGNFVVYDSTGPVWWTGTGISGAFLVVQDDGNTVIYSPGSSPLWATNTCCR